MKRLLSLVLCALFVVLIGGFDMVLCVQMISGDLFAIALFVWEIANVIYPFVFDETKMPQWCGYSWILSIDLWFICTIIWLVHLLSVC